MKTEMTDIEGGRKRLKLTAGWPEVAADYDDLFAAYGKLTLPGFRPGKAPRAVIEQHFRQQIQEDFASRCGGRLAREALRECGIRTSGAIEMSGLNLEPGRGFSLTAEFIAVPEFDLPDYVGVPLKGTTDGERRDELVEWLLENTPGEAPDALVQQECDRQGLADAQPGNHAWREAARRVKSMAILEQIAQTEGIEVDQHDLDGRIKRTADENQLRPDDLRRQLERDNGLPRLRSLLLAEQTLDYLIENAAKDCRRTEGSDCP